MVMGQSSYSDSLKSKLPISDDSLKVRIYNKLAYYYQDSAYNLSLEYAEKAYTLSKDNKWLWAQTHS